MSTNLTSKVFQQLRNDIITGTYQPGESLTELTLADHLHVSRTPIREALHQLELAELVAIIPNKGAVVIGISQEDICDIYQIRSLVEGLAAEKASMTASDADIERLQEVNDRFRFYLKRGDLERLQEIDSEFHEMIYQLSESRLLRHILSELHQYAIRFRGLSLQSASRANESLCEHIAIVEAIANRKSDDAKNYATLHVQNAFGRIDHLQGGKDISQEETENSAE